MTLQAAIERPDQRRRWYLLETKRHCEARAQAYLQSKGVGSYLPTTHHWPKPAVGSAVGPMFPGYLFARLDLAQDHSTVAWALGVKRFVTFGEAGPVEVPDAVIELLESRQGADGLIRCGGEDVRGMEVRLARGPLKDLRGVIEMRLSGRERVVLLMEFLRQRVRVEVPSSWIQGV